MTGRRRKELLAVLAMLMASGAVTTHAQSVTELRQSFLNPPNAARPMMRWWWFGPAVAREEIAREIDQMHAGGIGGFELASVYPMSLDDPAKGIVNLRYTSPEMVDMLRFAQEHGRSLGMRVDLTLGSGWPFGGPHIPIEQAAARLKVVALPGNAERPSLARGETLIAAFTAMGTPEHWDLKTAHRATVSSTGDIVSVDGAPKSDVKIFFIESRTQQMVKRPAVGGEGFVLDHMSKEAIATHLHAVGEPLLNGFKGAPPYAIFSDSLEVYGSDWTATLPAEFRRRRGYDLIEHLPELVQGGTPQAEAIRHDWGVTLSDLVRENYLRPMASFAAQHGTRFRSQTYGEPAATLADERVPQLPEGEGPQWKAFSFTRWTSSANHIFGNNVTSAETWTWLHSPAFRATPLDMKAEADRMFLEGVNQIVGHGWPYSAPTAVEPGWSLYAAGAFNAHNPWWPVMPKVTQYLQRVSWLLRQGVPTNDVAILLPEDDAQAEFHPGHVSVTVEMQHHITPGLMSAILDSGYNVDYIDAEAITLRGLHHRVLVVPPTRRLPVAMIARLQQYIRTGGKVIFLGEVPSLAPGLQDASESIRIAQAMASLRDKTDHVTSETDLPAALRRALQPDLDVSASHGAVGFLHRKLAGSDVYFIANTSPQTQAVNVTPRAKHRSAEWWDIETGKSTAATVGSTLQLEPYGSRVLILHDGAQARAVDTALSTTSRKSIPLAHWQLTLLGGAASPAMPQRTVADTVWTDDAATRFYSGEARYQSTFQAENSFPKEHLILHFADGKVLPETQSANKPGMRAWYEPPVREAAKVLVNGKLAGTLWHPPYDLDVTPLMKAGENTVEISVYNTGINELAGQPPRDYSALKAKYGDRFQMQDMDNLEPVPSGIVGPVQLEYREEERRAVR
jgi:hypothetical protein